MPNQLKINGEFKFKVKEALEPSEYQLEYWYHSRLLRFLLIFGALAFAAIICSMGLKMVLKQMATAYYKIPIYSD